MRNITLATILAASLAVPTLASADNDRHHDHDGYQDHDAYRDDHHQPPNGYRGDGRTKLVEVSADPRDGVDVIGVGRGHFDQLEVLATEDDVRLQRMEIRFSDGRVFRPQFRGMLAEGSRRIIDLPHRAGSIETIVLDYGSRHRRYDDRTSARIQIYGLQSRRMSDRRYDRRQDPYQNRSKANPFENRDKRGWRF